MNSSLSANILYTADALQDASVSLHREWLVTNGLGGYASATLGGANTRRYHGLLVAALTPPTGRAVLLSKLEETLTVTQADGSASAFALASNLYPGATYPTGFQWLTHWQAYPVPTWRWTLPLPGENGLRLLLEKQIAMPMGANAVTVTYRLLDAPAGAGVRLTLTPLLAWKDYHSEMRCTDAVPSATWTPPEGDNEATVGAGLRLELPPIARASALPTPLTLHLRNSDGTPVQSAQFVSQPDWYYRFQHPREQERGQDYEEDLYTPGSLSLTLTDAPDRCAEVVAALTDPVAEAKNVMVAPSHLETEAQSGEGVFADALLRRAANPFLIEAPGGRATIIAGYPWFADWGRDTMIALPGLCLTTERFALAREILLTFARYVSEGMIPNRFPDAGEIPEYNTADATLWYVVACYRYLLATGDTEILRATLWDTLTGIVAAHGAGTRYNIKADPTDQLLHAGVPGVQLTWMDAKVGDWVVTPRIGKPVEINALWINALHILADCATRLELSDRSAQYARQAQVATDAFRARFARPDGRGLYDVLDTPDGQADASIRPNQIFALSLPFPTVEPGGALAMSILQTVQEELLTPYGLRTLSPHDPQYRPGYEGDQVQRDGAYHQGTVWPWLLGPFVEAHVKHYGDRGVARALLQPLLDFLAQEGVGTLPEIFDADPPQRPNGCIAQAWSVAEILRVHALLR